MICRLAIATRKYVRFTGPSPGRSLRSYSRGPPMRDAPRRVQWTIPLQQFRKPSALDGRARFRVRSAYRTSCSRCGRRWGTRDDDRDIVRSPSPIRQRNKDLAGALRIARFDDNAMNVLVFHVIDEAIAAEQDAVAGLHGEASDVWRDLLVDSEGHGDYVFPRMVLRFLGQELPAIDHLLNEGMVPGHLENLSRIDDVDAGITRIRDMKAATVSDGEAQGRAHPLALRMPFGLRYNRLIRAGDGGSEVPVVRGSRDVLLARQKREERACDRLDRNPARHLPAIVSPHPVRDHQEQPGSGLG